VSRRAAVAGLTGGLSAGFAGLVACDPDRGGRDRSPGVSAGSPTEDPDLALVDRVSGELTELLALVTAVGARFGSLERRLRPFRELHQAHLEALDASSQAAPPSGSAAPAVPHAPAAAMRQLLARERRGHERLTEAAVAAASGQLARLLASMSAGVAQRLAVTTGSVGTGPA